MKAYRIYTEDVSTDQLADAVSEKFDGYTIFKGLGVWENEYENGAVVEIITDDESADIDLLAFHIKCLFHQQCVIVTEQDVECRFIE